jgi:hypothetical protein
MLQGGETALEVIAMSVIPFPGHPGRVPGATAPDFQSHRIHTLLAHCYRNGCHRECVDRAIWQIIEDGTGVDGLEALARRIEGARS